MDFKDSVSGNLFNGTFASFLERHHRLQPSVIVIGAGISGIAAAHILRNAGFEVLLLESRDRIGGRIHTDYSFGWPVDMGASWLHGVCNENPLAPLIRRLGLTLYRTSGDNSVLYDHDLESYILFDMDGRQVPQQIVIEVGDIFKRILKETEKVRDESSSDVSVLQAISVVLDRHPELRQEGLAHEVLQWYICRMEAWFAADADMISLNSWDEEHVLSGGHGLMVQGYNPVIKTLAKDIDIRLNHRKYKVQVREGVKIPESFELVLVDSEGTRIQATIPKMFMHKYGPKMNESAVYYISNFSVVENRGKYRITEHPLKIIFFNSTDIYSVTGLSFPKKVFSLISFPDLLALTDVDDCGLIDVVGRLVRKSKVKHIHNQRTSPGEKLIEVVLEDIGNNSLSCTLWGDYADEMFRFIETCGDSPLIVLIQLCKPKNYDGKITISNAFFATKLHVDPIVPEIAELKSLFAVESGSSHKISQIESSNAYSSYDELESGLANVLTVADLLECKEEGYFWVIGQISEVFVDGCWSFISCKVCMHKLDSVESGYFCKGCNNNITKAIPRYKVKVNVHSGDETAKFMLWDRCCETLVGQSALELKDHYIKITDSGKKEYCLPHCPDEIIAIVGKTAIFKVHLRDVNLSGKDQNFSSGSCYHGKSLVEKYIQKKIKVKKRIDVLAAIK